MGGDCTKHISLLIGALLQVVMEVTCTVISSLRAILPIPSVFPIGEQLKEKGSVARTENPKRVLFGWYYMVSGPREV
jgi:hypothetical protein